MNGNLKKISICFFVTVLSLQILHSKIKQSNEIKLSKNNMSLLSVHNISLIDLAKQFPFEIDNELKTQLCFSEALVISCGHYEGDVRENETERSWSCNDSTVSDDANGVKEFLPKDYELKDKVEDEEEDVKPPSATSSQNDFQFYFFPDCDKEPEPQHSKTSVIIVDGLPVINPAAKAPAICICKTDIRGKCICFSKLPCSCPPKNMDPDPECTCSKLEQVCICHSGEIHTVCTCTESKVCLCHPDNKPRPVCTCDEKIPCICHKSNALPVCDCDEEIECQCQVPPPKPPCRCLKGKDCTCLLEGCICGVQKACVCEPNDDENEPMLCENDDSKSVCSCDRPRECTCGASPYLCQCFPKKTCTCEDPDDCQCFHTCKCTKPCLCDYLLGPPQPPKEVENECVCQDKLANLEGKVICTCPPEPTEDNKLKRVKVTKEGYRWCHDVDPRHTYFDFGYGRHDKISNKEEPTQKVNILGLHDKEEADDVCPLHGTPTPQYRKKITQPSLDCCSAVGGISVSVETLGEDKGKFLIQVVSHASKEGAKTGTKMVSIIDCNFHTLEENRTEHITKIDNIKERRSYMAICENGYYNKVTRICGERKVVKRFYHSFDDAHDFLLEGANIVLMRYFGLRRYRGTVKANTVLIGGLICESVYVCQGVSQAVVNGKPLFVVKIERHIIEPCGFIHQTLTVLTLRGYMVSHEWANNSYILHLNPLLNIVPEKDDIEPHAPLRKTWRNDLQLLSDYLDFKSERTSEGGRYATENGALAGTIRDYLQALLLLRPSDALQFTRHYFSSALSTLDLPHDEYFDSCAKNVRYFFFEE